MDANPIFMLLAFFVLFAWIAISQALSPPVVSIVSIIVAGIILFLIWIATIPYEEKGRESEFKKEKRWHKIFTVILITVFILFAGLMISNIIHPVKQLKVEQLKHPIVYSGIPREVIRVTGSWKNGEFLVGYRIITDEYIITSSNEGLFGQDGFGGPGVVHYKMLESFGKIAEIAERIKNKEVMTFRGELAHTRKGDQLFFFNGKEVIDLLNATYNGQTYEVAHKG